MIGRPFPKGGAAIPVVAPKRRTASRSLRASTRRKPSRRLPNIAEEKAPPGARVSAAIALLDRAYGKAPTFSTSDTQAFKRAIDMTDDELAAIASGATLHVVK